LKAGIILKLSNLKPRLTATGTVDKELFITKG